MKRLRALAKRIAGEADVYRRVLKDTRTPWLPKLCLGLAIAYLASPIDLLPDFLPVLGQLDDLLIVPGLVYLAVKMIPAHVLAEHRAAVFGPVVKAE